MFYFNWIQLLLTTMKKAETRDFVFLAGISKFTASCQLSLFLKISAQLDQIRKVSLARIICDNSNIISIPPLAFRQPNAKTWVMMSNFIWVQWFMSDLQDTVMRPEFEPAFISGSKLSILLQFQESATQLPQPTFVRRDPDSGFECLQGVTRTVASKP